MKALLTCLVIASAAMAQNVSIYDPVREGMTEVRDLAVQAYEDLLAVTPGVSGTLDVTFVLKPDGTVCDVSVRGSEDLEPITETLWKAVSELTFPPLPAGSSPVTLSVPFEFRPPAE